MDTNDPNFMIQTPSNLIWSIKSESRKRVLCLFSTPHPCPPKKHRGAPSPFSVAPRRVSPSRAHLDASAREIQGRLLHTDVGLHAEDHHILAAWPKVQTRWVFPSFPHQSQKTKADLARTGGGLLGRTGLICIANLRVWSPRVST